MRRVVVHEILIGAGLALLLVAGVTTLTARRELRRFSADAAALRSRFDSLTAHTEPGPRDLPVLRQTAGRLEEAEFSVRATRELLARLWRPDGVAMLATVAGAVALGAGGMAWRRRRRDAATFPRVP